MKYKTFRVETEYHTLAEKNPNLWNLLQIIDTYTSIEWQKEITITHIFRTPEEHKALYAQTINPPATSPHCRWQGVDLRSFDFTEAQIRKLVSFINHFTYKGGQRPVALYHTISGNAPHFHLQFGGG